MFQPTLTVQGLSRSGLSLESMPVCKAVRGIIHSYLLIKATKATPYPVMQDGIQAVFNSAQGSMIGGAQSQVRDIQIPQAGEYFGIRFYPGELRHFFRLDLAGITDQLVDESYIPRQNFTELHHRIYQVPHFQQRANICEQWLLQHYQPRCLTQFDHALSLVYQTFGSARVSQLADSAGLVCRVRRGIGRWLS